MRTIRPETAATIANDIAEGTATHWRKHQIAAACQYWAMEASRLASELALLQQSAKVDNILTRLEEAIKEAKQPQPMSTPYKITYDTGDPQPPQIHTICAALKP